MTAYAYKTWYGFKSKTILSIKLKPLGSSLSGNTGKYIVELQKDTRVELTKNPDRALSKFWNI